MYSLTVLTAIVAALSGANAIPLSCDTTPITPLDPSCTVHEIPGTAICGAKGNKGNKNLGWYTGNKLWSNVDACIKACVADDPKCKSISWDPKQKICGMYTHTVESFKLEGVSDITYYDTACGFADSVDAVCGRTGVVGADDLQPYGNKVVEDDDTCLAFCKSDSNCKAVRFNTNGKRCYKYAQPVNAIGVKFKPDVRNVFYDIRCVECPTVVAKY
ncbi:hypothetical protein NW755_008105 [Fusarium falciforme]|uniref:Apple domain-containing protein n=1 Tax=Fusarium falciforme TaxID=195108 RepID=A0A9W8R386_9HYPO|nr:hypothetical protein NW755_008105 [Fusarium falciforme]